MWMALANSAPKDSPRVNYLDLEVTSSAARQSRNATATLPPGPALSVQQQTFAWLARPYDFLRECAQNLGDCFTIQLQGWAPHVVVADPRLLRDIFLADNDVLLAGCGNALLRPFLGTNSLLILDGQRHMQQRKLLLPPFHGERMRLQGSIIQSLTRQALARWPRDEVVALQEPLLDLSLETILHVVFGVGSDHSRHVEIKALLAELLRVISTGVAVSTTQHTPSVAQQRLQSTLASIDTLLHDEVTSRRGNTGGGDILTMLLQCRDEQGEGFTHDELRDQLLTLTLAGHETTATSLAWALQLLDANESASTRLEAELATVADDAPPDALAKLPYLNAVCQETLRLRPVVPVVSRWAKEPFQLGAWLLPATTFVVPSIFLTHQRPDLYPEPEAFRPERFLEKQFSPYEYLPFGGGVRRCIGMAFASYQMKIVLATILRSCRVVQGSPGPVRGVRRSVVVAPMAGCRVRINQRA